MIYNNNSTIAFNDFSKMPNFPYQILETLLSTDSEQCEMLWKLLKYSTSDCLDKDNLTYDEKYDLIWNGDSLENNYSLFIKPLIGSSLDSAEAQTQIRVYRYMTSPTDRISSTISFKIDFITNEKGCIIQKDGILVERTDLMESLFLNIMNGRDIGIGSGFLSYDRELTRNCGSQLSISNSKSFYGRSIVMGLNFTSGDVGEYCG